METTDRFPISFPPIGCRDHPSYFIRAAQEQSKAGVEVERGNKKERRNEKQDSFI